MGVTESFYLSLPQYGTVAVPGIPAYTKSLELYNGVRVVPDESFVETVSSKDLGYFKSVGFPCYFIPIFRGSECYGYVLKGLEKKTPSSSGWLHNPGIERIKKGCTVWLVEGIKDSYLPLKCKQVCVPMLSSGVTAKLLSFLRSMECKVVYVPDNDEHRQQFLSGFYKKLEDANKDIPGEHSAPKLKAIWVRLTAAKDLGDYFDATLREAVKNEFIQLYKGVKQWEASV